jgi:hypothetical protein
MARIAGRIGPENIGAPRVSDGHLPERYATATFDPPPAPKLRREPKNGRGLLAVRVLRPPVPLEVIVEEVESSELRVESTDSSRFPAPIAPPPAPAHAPETRGSHPGGGAGAGAGATSSIQHPASLPAPCDELSTLDSRLSTASLRLVSVSSESGATPRVQGLVRVAAGPWSLEDGWWNERPTERDYWDIELSGGRLYRIFRDRQTGDWFADGMYD